MPAQLLKRGGVDMDVVYTDERLDELCKEHTRGVWRLHRWARSCKPRSQFHADCNVMRNLANRLNYQIEEDMCGGPNGPDGIRVNLSGARIIRSNINLAAKRAINELLHGTIGEAHSIIKAACAEALQGGVDISAEF